MLENLIFDLSIGVENGNLCFYVIFKENTVHKSLLKGKNLEDANVVFEKLVGDVFKNKRLSPLSVGQKTFMVWSFSLKCYDRFVQTLKRKLPDCSISVIPDTLVKLFLSKDQKKDVKIINYDILSSLPSYKKLADYQKQAVRFAIENEGRAINAGEMGTGKTACGIVFLRYYEILLGGPQLVVCPSTLKKNWQQEIFKFTEKECTPVLKNSKDDFCSDGCSIVSYSLLCSSKMKPKLLRFSTVVLDESHFIKSAKSKRTKLILKLCAQAKHVLLLSGTPSSKSQDLYTQLKCVNPLFFRYFFSYKGTRFGNKITDESKFYFADRYCKPTKIFLGRNAHSFTYDGNDRSWELNTLLQFFMVRTTKEKVLADLPNKNRTQAIFDVLSFEEKNKFQREIQKIDDIRKFKGNREAQQHLMQIYRETSTYKLDTIKKYAHRLVSECEKSPFKCLLFAHHRFVLETLKAVMVKEKANYVFIDGRTKPDDRQQRVDEFQSDTKNVQFAVLSLKAAGTGLNLFKAHRVIFCELLWSEKDMLQA
jgi:SWI/SNF-related matrix-associated actin-dependent regulator 1 of chromatin subfamily A